MHKLAVAFFYACALLSISVTALVFIGKASAQHGGHVSGYESAARASLKPPAAPQVLESGAADAIWRASRRRQPAVVACAAADNDGLTADVNAPAGASRSPRSCRRCRSGGATTSR